MSRAAKAVGLKRKCLTSPFLYSLHVENLVSSRAELPPAQRRQWKPQGLRGPGLSAEGALLMALCSPRRDCPRTQPHCGCISPAALGHGCSAGCEGILEPTFKSPNLEGFFSTKVIFFAENVRKLHFNFLGNFSARRAGILYKSNHCRFHEIFFSCISLHFRSGGGGGS